MRALAALAWLSGLLAAAGVARAQQPAPAAPVVVDGPSPAISLPSGLAMSIARDGSGGLAYLKQVAGVPHVFVSVLSGGSFGAPVEVDGTLAGPSSQPVIAAGNDGLLLVGFINGGQLYVVQRPTAQTALGAPLRLAAGAGNPAISISNFGKAYLAFTVADGGGHDVRAAYYYNQRWSLEPSPLNVQPADDAGTGAGRPEVATAGDGVAIVVWGEQGHVFARRVWGTSPSVEDEQADGPLPGCTELSAGDPVVATEGDSSYADIAFQELASCGGQQQSRVLMNRLQGAVLDGITEPDGLGSSTVDGAEGPQITMGEYGRGWVLSTRQESRNLWATALGEDGVSLGTIQVNGLANAYPPVAVTATAGLFSSLIAWQQDPGAAGQPEIRVRYAPAGGALGPEMVVSSPAGGPTDAADGLAAAGDVEGDSAIAWIQAAAGGPEVVVAQLYQPPGPLHALRSFQYVRSGRPRLQWSAAREPWGPVRYTVSVDGAPIATTEATSLVLPAAITDGPHRWQVLAANPAGQQSEAAAATVFVDTVAPTVSLTLTGARRPRARLMLFVGYADRPPAGEPAADASGIAAVVIHWGDGTTVRLARGVHRRLHSYARPGRYTITVVATDGAGNRTRATLAVRIAGGRPRGRRG